jgi:hypothetical protein
MGDRAPFLATERSATTRRGRSAGSSASRSRDGSGVAAPPIRAGWDVDRNEPGRRPDPPRNLPVRPVVRHPRCRDADLSAHPGGGPRGARPVVRRPVQYAAAVPRRRAGSAELRRNDRRTVSDPWSPGQSGAVSIPHHPGSGRPEGRAGGPDGRAVPGPVGFGPPRERTSTAMRPGRDQTLAGMSSS